MSGCPLDGQADAEMFGLDSSSSSKHKMACMWCNSRPRPGLSVTQEGPESSARRAGSLGIFREGLKCKNAVRVLGERLFELTGDTGKMVSPDIHQIAAGSFANLPRFRVLGNPAPLARAVDGDGTSRRHAER